VHGKKSLLDKMHGEYIDKFSSNRAYVGYMMAHPGKKLTFMGEEFGQFKEWDYKEGLEFFLIKYPTHKALSTFYADINEFYVNNSALWSIDNDWQGFSWLDVDNSLDNILSFSRKGLDDSEIIAIINFSGKDALNYKVHVNRGRYKVAFSSDSKKYGGQGKVRKKIYVATKHIKENYEGFTIDLPKLSFVYLKKEI
jgi:1,4-alpha-glucan branching enzyme